MSTDPRSAVDPSIDHDPAGPPPVEEPPVVEPPVDDAVAAESASDESRDGEGQPVRYEVVFDCRDRMVGGRLVARIADVMGPTFPVTKGEEGPTWSVTIEFPSAGAADRFFASDFYRQFCIEVRRSAHSSVLVVPLGSQEE